MRTAFSLLMLGAALCAQAQRYTLNAPDQPMQIEQGHLLMGGTSNNGHTIDVNSFYMSIDGKPVVPVTGEFHYIRYPEAQWEEEILKMKAGGVTVLPTYVFWSLHEEQEGVFNWSGNRNLRHFVELCRKHDMMVIMRIGPFCHGEIRNGALPDWLFAKPIDVRSDDSAYLAYVGRLYAEIGKQLDGLYFKDGGPIIGVQIENEHQHTAAPWGINYPGEKPDYTSASYDKAAMQAGVSTQEHVSATARRGERHMQNLKRLANEAGIITPIYTVTGWGNAATLGYEALPVTAAYPVNFWSTPEPSPFCIFKDLHAHPDYEPVRYKATDFPSFCAEMGVGMQPIYRRRPIVTAQGAEALMLRTLGSGANGIGYYMYHGGSTPKMPGGVGSYQDEPMGMPKVSYDYMAPLGEFGLEHKSYRTLRLIHSFLADFGDRLAPMETVLPDGWERMTPDNRDDLRYAARMKDGSGFVFMVNFQDHDTLRHDQSGIKLDINLKGETITIPSGSKGLTLPKDASVILPFNMDLSGALLKYATAQPLMLINDGGVPHYFFFAIEGMDTEFAFADKTYRPTPGFNSTFTVKGRGSKVMITTLTRDQALDASKVNGRLLITKATTLPAQSQVTLLQMGDTRFDYIVYPSKHGFKPQTATVAPAKADFQWKLYDKHHLTVQFDPTQDVPQVNDWFLHLDYTGDVGMAFLDNTMTLDHFWYGQPWVIGLKRFPQMASQALGFYFRPIESDATYLIDIPEEKLPDFSNGPVLRYNSIDIVPQYRTTITVERN